MSTSSDEMTFVIDNYGEEIQKYLGTKSLAATFYNDSEFLVDSVTPIETSILDYNGFKISYYQDYSFDDNIIKDFNYCTIGDYKFVKIVTPFTHSESYDFIIADENDITEIVRLLKGKEQETRESKLDFPIIGLDFTELKKNTIDFLLNEDFREYCRKKNIKLKRGIVLEGKPGTGKTLSIQWLKHEASKNGIKVINFKDIESFLKNQDEYYTENKSIFVFEDFDAALLERTDTGGGPNQILAQVLNTLDGIDRIEDVVSIFTTNEIKVFDSAFLRPGRIDKVFTYILPGKEDMKLFFEAYISEEQQFFDDMVHLLDNLDGEVSYAVLKGICDEINIWKFNKETIDFNTIEDIIKDKLQRKTAVDDKSRYVI